MSRKLFCDINPVCYQISLKKEILKRHIKNLFNKDRLAKDKNKEPMSNIIAAHSSILVRRLEGVDLKLQENKVTNIKLACDRINGIIVHPGETFSFWKTIGKTSKRKGYKEGLVVTRKGFKSGVGGGLCQMANLIHYLVLNSPLETTELHHHGDALFPDERRRVPFGTGTSVCYNTLDYRFKNTSSEDIQILAWIQNGEVCGELRNNTPFPYRYKLVEEDHHFKKENGVFYRNSLVYKITIDKKTNKELNKELILKNHSKVLYDYKLIPKKDIRK